MKFTNIYLIGGDKGKADNTDYVVSYKAENGMIIEIKELVNSTYRWYKVGNKEVSTLNEAKQICMNQGV